jgi:hypothetical protein
MTVRIIVQKFVYYNYNFLHECSRYIIMISWLICQSLPESSFYINMLQSRKALTGDVITGTSIHWGTIYITKSYQRISPGPRLCAVFHNLVIFYGEELLAPRPTPKLEGHPLSAVRDCLYNVFAGTLHIRRPFLHPQPEGAPCRGDRDRLIMD